MLKNLFSIINDGNHKVISVLGCKFKFRNTNVQIQDLKNKSNECSDKINECISLLHHQIFLAAKNEIDSIQILNKIKENILKEKIKNGHKAKVFLLVDYISRFGMDTIYKEMEKSPIFEPYVLVTHARDTLFNENEIYYEEALQYLKIFNNKGYRTIFAYDKETRKRIPLEDLNPDIIFYNDPNMFPGSLLTFSSFNNTELNFNYLTCYVAYAMYIVENPSYHFDNNKINTAWKNFVELKHTFQGYFDNHKLNAINCVLTGYPKLDSYIKPIEECVIPEKINNGKDIVIYAPHWSINFDNNMATFHKYFKLFMSLLKENPDINFVFKPHPLLKYKLQKEDGNLPISFKEYQEYVEEWDNSPNGQYFDEGEYVDLFKKSCCLITDSGSFVGEYLPSGNPCMYLLNTDKENPLDTYNKLGKKILNSYYLCNNEQEIKETFKKVVLEKKDQNKKQRMAVLQEEYTNIGSSGQEIVNYLERIFKD